MSQLSVHAADHPEDRDERARRVQRETTEATPAETAERARDLSRESAEVAPPEAAPHEKDKAEAEKPKRKKRSRWRVLGTFLLVIVVLLGIARVIAPWGVRWYVNRTIDQSPLYDGKIGQVHLHLWRGAYSIDDVRLIKTTGNVPVPLFAARRVDFAMQWDALLHGKLVGRVLMVAPELNFVDNGDPADSQVGDGGPWLKIIRDLFPFKINRAEVQEGSVHFRAYQKETPVDVYLSQMDAKVDNLTNIRDEVTPLVTTVDATALAMDQAKFEYHMKLDPFSYKPTFHLAVRLLGLDVTKINDLALAYGSFDFKRGWFDLVIELDSKEGQLEGYVKPLFRELKIFSLKRDLQEDNPIQFFWSAVVGITTKILSNPPRDQFGTRIPFSGSVDGPQPDILATIGGVLRNAFVRAYLPKLHNGSDRTYDGIEFRPAEMSDPISVGEHE